MKQISNVEIVRLKAMANMLDTVHESEFNLSMWVKQLPQQPTTRLFGLVQTNPGCGFAGCAMGWAAHLQIFPGIGIGKRGHVVYRPPSLGTNNATPTTELRAWDATMAVFGISRNMAYYLFSPDRYKMRATPATVSKRVRRLIAKIETIRARDRRRIKFDVPELRLVVA